MTAPIDIPALKAAAMAATPGPWEWIGRHYLETANKEIGWKHPSGGQVIECTSHSHGYLGSTEVLNVHDSDRAYIALANPAVVLALIERLERAEAVAEYARSREMPTTEKQVKAAEMFFTAPMMARLEKMEARIRELQEQVESAKDFSRPDEDA